MPPDKQVPRERRRADPLADIFESEIVPLRQSASGIWPVAMYDELRWRQADMDQGIRRTLERRVRALQARHGQERDIMFRQMHKAVQLAKAPTSGALLKRKHRFGSLEAEPNVRKKGRRAMRSGGRPRVFVMLERNSNRSADARGLVPSSSPNGSPFPSA